MVENLHQSLFRYPVALNYLKSRGLIEEEIREHKIGYAGILGVPQDNSEDRKRFMEESYKGRSFEHKIIFPIFNPMGVVTGIIGRSLKEGDVKYRKFFSDEAKITGCFFGLPQALPYIYETGAVFVSEGALDCIPLRRVIKNTVGTLTNGLNDDQYEFLSFYCDNIITIFDSDKWGQIEAYKAKKKWKNVYTLELGYKDPNECLEHMSEDRFKQYLNKKLNTISPFLRGVA